MPGRYNPDDYEPVEDRIRAFWKDHADGRIYTVLQFRSETQYVFSAEVFFHKEDHMPTATGYAEEVVGSSPVNRTNALENCETSAIGRALANAGYATKGKRPSREEMEKANRVRVNPAAAARDELRRFCRENGVDMNAVVAAYTRIHHMGLGDDPDAERIAGFTELLRLDANAVLNAKEVNE